MIVRRKNAKGKTRYGVKLDRGDSQVWIGTFDTLGEARAAEAKARHGSRTHRMTCDAYVEHYLEGYAERVKASTYETAKTSLDGFAKDFKAVPLDRISHIEAERWARANKWRVPAVVTLFNAAKRTRLVDENPFVGLSKKGEGRKRLVPLTVAEVDQLAHAAFEVHNGHGPMMRALTYFLAYTGMRVGEVFALEWTDIDFEKGLIHVERRVYKGNVDLPKSNRKRTIVLTPQARDAIADLPRTTRLIFTAKQGQRFSQSLMSWYWGKVTARFGRKVTPHELRHFAAHYLYVSLGLPARTVAVQLGHDDGGRLIEDLYGHGDVGALEEIQRAFDNVIPITRPVAKEGF